MTTFSTVIGWEGKPTDDRREIARDALTLPQPAPLVRHAGRDELPRIIGVLEAITRRDDGALVGTFTMRDGEPPPKWYGLDVMTGPLLAPDGLAPLVRGYEHTNVLRIHSGEIRGVTALDGPNAWGDPEYLEN